MNRACREYINSSCIGDHKKCLSLLTSLRTQLNPLVEQNVIGSYLGGILHTVEDVENEWLNIEEVNSISKGVFPVVWLNITFDLDIHQIENVLELEKEYALAIMGDTYIEQG